MCEEVTVADIQKLRKRQREVLGQIAINNDGGHHPKTLKALQSKGLIVAEQQEVRGPFRGTTMTITRWYVPIAVHMVWCTWCSEQESSDIGGKQAARPPAKANGTTT